MMETCPEHNRWIRIDRADGTTSERKCPECPRTQRRFLHEAKTYELDRREHSTVLAALIHYSMHVAEPSECIRCLQILVPEPKKPWDEIITEARAEQRRSATGRP